MSAGYSAAKVRIFDEACKKIYIKTLEASGKQLEHARKDGCDTIVDNKVERRAY